MIRELGPWPPQGLRLYPFRYFDDMRGKWLRAGYVAEFAEIAARYARFEITGPPEIRLPGGAGHFRTPAPADHRRDGT